MYVNIDDNFFIKYKKSDEILLKSIEFVANQKKVKYSAIKKVYEKKDKVNIDLPKNSLKNNFDIIVKRNFKRDLKFIDIKKFEIFYKTDIKTDLFIERIKKFKLLNIKFFPKTFLKDDFIFQKLSKGNFYRPNKLSEISNYLLKEVAEVVNVLSSNFNKNLKVLDFLENFELNLTNNKLTKKIVEINLLKLNKSNNKDIKFSLTHGDLKFEHLFLYQGKLEYVIDWETVESRSIFFDLFNFFVPWFARRSYNYFEIKKFILNFIENHLPNLESLIQERYDLYFNLFVLERFSRIKNSSAFLLDKEAAFERFNDIFKNFYDEIND